MKILLTLIVMAGVFSGMKVSADQQADIACRAFGTTRDICLNITPTYNCIWTGCTSSNKIFAGVCNLNRDAAICSTNNAGGNCAWVGCRTLDSACASINH